MRAVSPSPVYGSVPHIVLQIACILLPHIGGTCVNAPVQHIGAQFLLVYITHQMVRIFPGGKEGQCGVCGRWQTRAGRSGLALRLSCGHIRSEVTLVFLVLFI